MAPTVSFSSVSGQSHTSPLADSERRFVGAVGGPQEVGQDQVPVPVPMLAPARAGFRPRCLGTSALATAWETARWSGWIWRRAGA